MSARGRTGTADGPAGSAQQGSHASGRPRAGGASATGANGTGAPAIGATAALFLLFFLSGAVGLLYEVVWFRRLHLVLGVSVFAMGAVVSAFMAGLAAGSRWAGMERRLWKSPLRAYALLEVVIGLCALAFPAATHAVERLHSLAFPALQGHFLSLSLLRFVLSLIVLLPPTFCMGATYPVLTQALRGGDGFARRAGLLYAVNTAGGALGTLFAGFWALERLGISGTLHLGVALNLVVAAAAFVLARTTAGAPAPAELDSGTPEPDRKGDSALSAADSTAKSAPKSTPGAAATDGSQRVFRLLLLTVAATGLASMAGEVLWTRALVFYVHNSTYAFSAILAVYLIGLGLGAAAASVVARRVRPAPALAWTCLAISASLLVAIVLYRTLPSVAGSVLNGRLPASVTGFGDPGMRIVPQWSSALFAIFLQAAFVLLIPAFLFGAVMPLAIRAGCSGGPPAATIGRLYAANTVGSIVGTVLGTFVLVPLLGTRLALLAAAWIPLIPAVVLAARAGREPAAASTRPGAGRFFHGTLVAAGALLVLGFAAAPSGFYRDMFARRFGPVVWFGEGASETVAICKHPDGSAWIQYSDGRGASGTSSYRGGWLYAHLPLLLHPDPKSAVVICFGTGNTLGAASQHGLARLDGVELSSEVVHASSVFRETNFDVAKNPAVRIVIEDGRNYLLGTREHYDVVTEEPPLVHTAGVVNLYSRDFYRLCSERMTDDGIMAVWLATWELEDPEVRALVRAFTDVFPFCSAWDSMHPGEWILIGSKKPLRLDPADLAARMAREPLRTSLRKIGIERPEDLLSLYLKGDAFLRSFGSTVAPVTDDRSVVDYTVPRRARANFGLGEGLTSGIKLSAAGPSGLVSELRFRPFDSIYALRDRPDSLLASTSPGFAAGVCALQTERSVQAARRIAYNVSAMAQDLYVSGRPEDALRLLDQAAQWVCAPATADLIAMRGVLLARAGRKTEAREAAARALAIDPEQKVAGGLLRALGG